MKITMSPVPIPRILLRRFYAPSLALILLLGACTIEQTPQEYIDRQQAPAREIEASRRELTDRLRLTSVSLQRGDRRGIVSALAPASGMEVIGLEPGQVIASGEELAQELALATSRGVITLDEPVIDVDSQNGVAWFRASFHLASGDSAGNRLYFSGVFVRQSGEWRLTQGHISRPTQIGSSAIAPV